jgi:hypothetical protein
VNPLARLLQEDLPAIDVGVMSHGFAAHGRDYIFVLENSFGPYPGTYRLTFTHVVEFSFTTAVGDDVWQRSWTDDFIDYERWEAVGEPDGYVFGNNWSLAYPGFEAIDNDPSAGSWSARLQRAMHAGTIETDCFKIALVFHHAHMERISGDASKVSKVIIPLPPAGSH